jgi:hypothetical protein
MKSAWSVHQLQVNHNSCCRADMVGISFSEGMMSCVLINRVDMAYGEASEIR